MRFPCRLLRQIINPFTFCVACARLPVAFLFAPRKVLCCVEQMTEQGRFCESGNWRGRVKEHGVPRLQPKNLTYQFCPIQARMEQVGDYKTVIATTEHFERLGSVPRRINLESRLLKDMCSKFANA